MNPLDAMTSRPPDAVAQMRQIPLDLGPDLSLGLDDFIVGRNEEVLAWLKAWPQVPGALSGTASGAVSPAYVWGPSGAGKTHLMRAMVERALSMGFGAIWLNAQGCQMWDADDAAMPTLAVIDECGRLPEDHQHLAFNLFIQSASSNAAMASTTSRRNADPAAETDDAGGPLFIIAAGSLPAVDLPVRDDLRTRLGWGLTFALEPLDEPGLRAALRKEAERRGMALSDEVVAYLLTRHSRDLGFLMGLLERLDRFALAEHRLVTVPLLKQMLALETA